MQQWDIFDYIGAVIAVTYVAAIVALVVVLRRDRTHPDD